MRCPRLLVLPVLLATASAIASCAGAGGASDPTSSVVTSPAPTNQSEGAVKDLLGITCAADAKGVWSFQGIVRNSSEAQSTYTVVISVVARAGSTVKGSGSSTVKLAPGKSQQLRIDRIATTAKAADFVCVRNVTVRRG